MRVQAVFSPYFMLYVTRHEKTGLAYAQKIHLFMLRYVPPLLLKILEIYKLHKIPYEKLCINDVNFIRLL